MIKGKNESKIFRKDISCEYKCKIDKRKCNSDQKWNNDNCPCECKKTLMFFVKMVIFLLHVFVKMENI